MLVPIEYILIANQVRFQVNFYLCLSSDAYLIIQKIEQKDAIPLVDRESLVAKKRLQEPHWSIQQMSGRRQLFLSQV
jgi:hypothetical protein